MAGDTHYQDFEKPIFELEKRIEELESFQQKAGVDVSEKIAALRVQRDEARRDVFAKLTPWQRVQLARDPNRPDSMDYLPLCFDEFVELHGDKAIADDRAILTGLGKIGGIRALLVAHRKGRSTKERMECNFGSPHPEGYRKALEKMKLAEKFRIPIVTWVNTPGAYPGIDAEERGQATIIARNLLEMAKLRTPVVSVVIGEGGSGGALGISVCDRLALLEHSYLSVISPEGCAAILWHDASKAPVAAELLRLTPPDLLSLGVIDEIIPEPAGGAHRNHKGMGETLKAWMVRTLDELAGTPLDTLLDRRYEKYRKMGAFLEGVEGKLAMARKE